VKAHTLSKLILINVPFLKLNFVFQSVFGYIRLIAILRIVKHSKNMQIYNIKFQKM